MPAQHAKGAPGGGGEGEKEAGEGWGHLMRRPTLTAYTQRGMRSEAGRKGSMIPADP